VSRRCAIALLILAIVAWAGLSAGFAIERAIENTRHHMEPMP
jgi:hypothetical protein